MAGAIAPATVLRRDQDRPGARSPRPALAPPPAGASRPPGRASAVPGLGGLQGTVPRGRGKRDAFLVPARTGEGTFNASMAGAIAPATAPRRDQDRPGAQSPRPAPAPPPAGASPRRVGRWPAVVPGPAGLQGTAARGRGNAMRFLIPPGQAKGPSTPQWQGPWPLPQRPAGIRTGRGPKAPGQRSPCPRRALLARRVGRWPFVVPGPTGLHGTVALGRGNALRFLIRPEG
jgi:hypothetical protein